MIIRKGTEEDLPFVGMLWLEMVQELAPEYNPNPAWWLKMAFNAIQTGNYHLWIAQKELFYLIGFLDYFIYPEPSTGKLHAVGQHFYVEPEYRKTRLAGQLYKASVKHAKSCGAEVMELFAFERQSELWQRKGYIPVRSMLRKDIKNV